MRVIKARIEELKSAYPNIGEAVRARAFTPLKIAR
jgi:hypothetical protein